MLDDEASEDEREAAVLVGLGEEDGKDDEGKAMACSAADVGRTEVQGRKREGVSMLSSDLANSLSPKRGANASAEPSKSGGKRSREGGLPKAGTALAPVAAKGVSFLFDDIGNTKPVPIALLECCRCLENGASAKKESVCELRRK